MSNVKYINIGIASRVGKDIYLNKRLKSHRKLKNALLKHEKAHTDGYSVRDFLLDIELHELEGMKKEYWKFVLHNPSSWVEFLPIKKYGDVILFNFPIFLMWLFAGGMAWFIINSVM